MSKKNITESKEGDMIGRILFNKYTLEKKIGQGSFGSIYEARAGDELFAIKFEDKNKGQFLLENEAYIMSYLNGPRIPYVKSFGYSGDYNVLVMELMGESLEKLHKKLPSMQMSVRCVCNIGYQMIEIMEYIHNKHIIHRDIKPDNFVIGRNEKKKFIYLLDFGLSKKYRSSTTLKHYPFIQNKKLTGTARYASVNALSGGTQSRRDDLEAIGYVLLYFLKGKLPWQGAVTKSKENKYIRIMEIKRDIKPEDLCNGFPVQFQDYVKYTKNLEYEQDPDYNYLKQLFLNVLKDQGYELDYYYDWDTETLSNVNNENANLPRDCAGVFHKISDLRNNNKDHQNNNEEVVVDEDDDNKKNDVEVKNNEKKNNDNDNNNNDLNKENMVERNQENKENTNNNNNYISCANQNNFDDSELCGTITGIPNYSGAITNKLTDEENYRTTNGRTRHKSRIGCKMRDDKDDQCCLIF